jgi:hypothetical protein
MRSVGRLGRPGNAARRTSRIRHWPCRADLLFSRAQGETMKLARAVLAFLIAVSLAALPVAGQAHVAVSAMNHMGTDMSATDDMDCCPHKTDTSKKAIDDCAAMAGCVLCTGFLGAAASSLNFHP